MAINSYFYNAIYDSSSDTYDRLYNAEDVTSYLDQIVGSGVFPNPSTQLQVRAGTGMQVTVNEGQGWIQGHKIINTADLNLSVAASDVLLGRIDRVIFYTDSSERTMGIEILQGTPSVNPTAPALTRTEARYEMSLATISVSKGITSITDAMITDTRADSTVCGWVAGLIQQLDTSSLFVQWNTAYSEMMEQMQAWLQNQKDTFDAWYYNLTENLTVGAYIKKYSKVVVGGAGVSNVIALDMAGYSYDSNDVILANLNGLALTPTYDYLLDTSKTPVEMHINGQLTSGNLFEVIILKSNMAQTTGGLLTSAKGETLVHITDALPEAAQGFKVGTEGTTNTIVVTNRNLFRGDQIDSDTVDGVTFTKNEDGSFTISGTSTADNAGVSADIDKEAFIVGQEYTINSGKTDGSSELQLTLNYTDETSDTFVSSDDSYTFMVEKEVESASASIQVTTSGTTVSNETIYPQIEVGNVANEFVANSYDTFTYDGETMPVFTDTIDNIWSTDTAVRDIQVIYVVLETDVDGDGIRY